MKKNCVKGFKIVVDHLNGNSTFFPPWSNIFKFCLESQQQSWYTWRGVEKYPVFFGTSEGNTCSEVWGDFQGTGEGERVEQFIWRAVRG